MKKKLLLIEDEKEIADIMSVVMAGEFIVHHAASRKEALALYQTEEFDVILSDINIKKSDGIHENGVDIIEDLITLKSVPVLFMTGYVDNLADERIRSIKEVKGLITKPFDLDGVLKQLLEATES